jgi:hypothetical protein
VVKWSLDCHPALLQLRTSANIGPPDTTFQRKPVVPSTVEISTLGYLLFRVTKVLKLKTLSVGHSTLERRGCAQC